MAMVDGDGGWRRLKQDDGKVSPFLSQNRLRYHHLANETSSIDSGHAPGLRELERTL